MRSVKCRICPHECEIDAGVAGKCSARQNIDGRLAVLNYGEISSIALDTVEKKPLREFYPDSLVLSVGTFGCNLSCSFCQNWEIAQSRPRTVKMTPVELVGKAKALEPDGNIGLAYTYNEPTIFYEFMLETAMLCRQEGMKNLMVSNGFINVKPLLKLLEYIDAVNIDLKGNDDFYKTYCGAWLSPVLDSIETAVNYGTHIEVTFLLIPGINDGTQQCSELFYSLSKISPDIPLHIIPFYPNYQMQDIRAANQNDLIFAAETASAYMNKIYVGGTLFK